MSIACTYCHKPLRNPKSIQRRAGKICWDKHYRGKSLLNVLPKEVTQ